MPIATTHDLRDLAETRLDEAESLLGAGMWSGAFYLAGYVVELALKAVLTKELREHSMPDKKGVSDAHEHDLQKLARQAGLQPHGPSSPVRVYWNTLTNDWSPDARYRQHSEKPAGELVRAAREVLAWLKQHW